MRHRWLYLVALLIGASYYAHHWMPTGGPMVALWKGTGVGLLAIWAVVEAQNRDGLIIALVLALGAFGDVLLETHGLVPGALAFLAAHLVAVRLYLRHRARSWLVVPAAALVLALVAATGLGGTMRYVGAAYALALGAMAGAALVSRFRLAGIGAILFVVSDLLIFAQMGPLSASPLPLLLTWPTYFTAQALIAWSVVTGLKAQR